MPKPNVRDKLLNAGLDTVHRYGFNGCSVQDIAQAAEVPKGSFYNHFESKERFGVEILNLYWQKMVNTNLQILSDRTLSPLERLKCHFQTLAKVVAESNYERGCLFGNLGAELSEQSYIVREQLSLLLASWQGAIEGCIGEAQIAGEISSNLNPSELAAFVVNAWEGSVLRAKIDRNGSSFERFYAVIFSLLLG
jgi:TetR/AcrR family transcriptional regulator, transcriptional repressor for nem operon